VRHSKPICVANTMRPGERVILALGVFLYSLYILVKE
jgi:hypothetical protein